MNIWSNDLVSWLVKAVNSYNYLFVAKSAIDMYLYEARPSLVKPILCNTQNTISFLVTYEISIFRTGKESINNNMKTDNIQIFSVF